MLMYTLKNITHFEVTGLVYVYVLDQMTVV